MDATNNIATDLFYKIRSRFTGLKLGESTGQITINPEDARFFDFDYTEGDKNIGHVSISLAEPNSMKVYFSNGITEGMDSDQKNNWYDFLKELRMFAKRRLLAFDTRDIAKDNLDKRDYAFLSQHSTPQSDSDTITKPVGETVMNESNLYGTKTQSFQKLLDTRLIIKHSKTLADDHEQKPGDRARNISALFVENQDGERFKYPFIHLAGARAMQRHVANGGLPYDAIGESIIRMSEEIAQLKSFTNYCVRNDLMNSDTNNIVERSKAQLDGLRERVARLSKQAHYENYVAEFQAPEAMEVPDDVMEEYKEKFTVKNFKEDLTSVFPVLYRLMKEEESLCYDDIVGMTNEVSSMGMNKYGLAAKKVDGKFYSYKDGEETGGPFDSIEELKKHQEDLLNNESDDPMAKFEAWVDSLGEESPIVSADEEEKADMIKKLNELVGQDFSAGVDGTNAIQSLEGIIEDPKLEQDIKKKATEDANTDVRPLVKAWVEENAPDVLDQLDFGDMIDEPAVGADEVEPQQEEEVAKEGGMSDVMIGVDELISDYTNDGDKESGLKMSKQEVINAIKGEKADPMEIKFAIDTIENDFDDKGNYKYVGQDDMPEGNEFSKKVQDLKAQGAKKGTKFKTSDGEEHTLEGLAEFINSFYDKNTGTFPKGPEGVCTMVGKKFGEQAEQIARKFVERMAPHQEQGAEELEELERIKNLAFR